jgi:tetratricopeptide (TPR) repeat protein
MHTMAPWTAFAHASDFPFDADSVMAQWALLHAGDQEPLPQDPKVLAAWVLFHQGAFQNAVEAGLQAGPAGITVANKATCIYANYLEPKERTRLDLFLQVAERAAAQAIAEPGNANAFYWQAYALGRYSQGISVAKALAQGLGGTVKSTLETAIRLQPNHADAHIALGAFHAEVIDKVGALIGSMTYGVKKDASLGLFQRALTLTPQSAIARIELANALVMLEGEDRVSEATGLYELAAASKPIDAMERLDVELAQTELAD